MAKFEYIKTAEPDCSHTGLLCTRLTHQAQNTPERRMAQRPHNQFMIPIPIWGTCPWKHDGNNATFRTHKLFDGACLMQNWIWDIKNDASIFAWNHCPGPTKPNANCDKPNHNKRNWQKQYGMFGMFLVPNLSWLPVPKNPEPLQSRSLQSLCVVYKNTGHLRASQPLGQVIDIGAARVGCT